MQPALDPIWSPVVELRRYTLRPGRRDVLIDLFERHFIEGQEQVGMKVIGQFLDLDDPAKFTWLRGFRDMPERAQSLAGFYGGPIWQRHRDAANATMIDSDDVLLLKPARRDSAFTLGTDRPPPGPNGAAGFGFVEATILHLESPAEETEIVSYFEDRIAPSITGFNGSVLAYFVTDASENNFPRLPLREGVSVFVWFAGFSNRGAFEQCAREHATVQVPGLAQLPQVMRLAPTSRSLVNGRSHPCRATVHTAATEIR